MHVPLFFSFILLQIKLFYHKTKTNVQCNQFYLCRIYYKKKGEKKKEIKKGVGGEKREIKKGVGGG